MLIHKEDKRALWYNIENTFRDTKTYSGVWHVTYDTEADELTKLVSNINLESEMDCDTKTDLPQLMSKISMNTDKKKQEDCVIKYNVVSSNKIIKFTFDSILSGHLFIKFDESGQLSCQYHSVSRLPLDIVDERIICTIDKRHTYHSCTCNLSDYISFFNYYVELVHNEKNYIQCVTNDTKYVVNNGLIQCNYPGYKPGSMLLARKVINDWKLMKYIDIIKSIIDAIKS